MLKADETNTDAFTILYVGLNEFIPAFLPTFSHIGRGARTGVEIGISCCTCLFGRCSRCGIIGPTAFFNFEKSSKIG